jgi:hypothetical protein
MPNAIAYKNLVEVIARVFFVQQLQTYDGRGLIKLELTNSSQTLTAKVDAALVRGCELGTAMLADPRSCISLVWARSLRRSQRVQGRQRNYHRVHIL